MFKLIGLENNVKNVFHLSRPYMKGLANKTVLIQAYREFLKISQPKVLKPNSADVCFKWKKEDVDTLRKNFEEESLLDDFDEVFDSTTELSNAEPLKIVESGFNELKKICPNFSELIDLVVHTVFTSPSKLAGGGSTSAAIGCIWVNPRPYWTTQDIIEFFVHETTHNLVFIDELCHTHYTDYSKLLKEENFARSAILNRPRPLDKVFHSIVVSLEILAFREEHLGHSNRTFLHPPSDILIDQTRESIRSVSDNQVTANLLNKRAKDLLKKCEISLEFIKNSRFCAV